MKPHVIRNGFLYSDDYGYKPAADKKILEDFLSHKISGLSVLSTMIRGESLKHMKQLAAHSNTSMVGLHINLVEGKSLCKKREIESLVDKNGNFYSLPIFYLRLLLGRIEKKHIEREITKQYEFLKKRKIHISTIDSHQHIHAFTPVSDIVAAFAHKHHIPVVRCYGNVITLSWTAKAKYYLLKMLSYVSFAARNQSLGLSDIWEKNAALPQWVCMSWENPTFPLKKQVKPSRNITYVIHPYLPFDTDRSYATLLG